MANICWRVSASLTGARGTLGGHDGEHVVRVRCALGAEAAADVLGDHADLVLEPERRRERLADDVHALGRVVERQAGPSGGPNGDGGVGLHRVVVLVRRGVRRVDGDVASRRAASTSPSEVSVGTTG